jgi:hypothetical protein
MGSTALSGSASAQPFALSPDWEMAPLDQARTEFGAVVAAVGDVNGDGYEDLAIGAPRYTGQGTGEGRVYLYLGGPQGLSSTPAWVVDSVDQADRFGHCIAGGDVDGDGYSDVLITAHWFSGQAQSEGRAYLFRGGPTGLSPTPAWVVDPTDQANAHFGYSCDVVGDVNGDGFADVVIGAFRWSGENSEEGRVYLFLGSPDGLGLQPVWTADPLDQNGAWFGSSVRSAGDVNADGYVDVIIGATLFDAEAVNEGVALLYLGGPGGLGTTAAWIQHPTDVAQAYFGNTVRSAGDVNGDGYGDVYVGAYGWSGARANQGRGFVFAGGPGGLSQTPLWELSAVDKTGAAFGADAVALGDVDGDGVGDLALSSLGASGDVAGEGVVFVHLGELSSPALSAVWSAHPTDQSSSQFGWPLTAGDFNGDGFTDLVVGAALWTGTSIAQGKAYLWNGGRFLTPRADSLRQMRGAPPDGQALPVGEGVTADELWLGGELWPLPGAGGRLILEVEVKPVGTPFDGAGLLRSPPGVFGAEAWVALTGWAPGPYHWRARIRSPTALTSSAWFDFGANSEADSDFHLEMAGIPDGGLLPPDAGEEQRDAGNEPSDAGLQPDRRDPLKLTVGCGCQGSSPPLSGCALALLVFLYGRQRWRAGAVRSGTAEQG